MEFYRTTEIGTPSTVRSICHFRHLASIALVAVLLTACSTKIETDTTGATVATGGDLTNNQDYTYDQSGDGSSLYTPDDMTDYTIPSTTTTTTNSTPLSCYIYRPGGYFPVGMPIPWKFGTDTGDELEIVAIGAQEPWVTEPTYPLPAEITIYFNKPGTKKLSFLVRSKAEPNRYCNQGYRINDQVYINPGY